jgi:hypothetical protein
MKLQTLISSAFALVVFGVAAVASASDTVNHGSQCNSQPADVSKVEFNQVGATNNSSTSIAAIGCGAATQILATINTVQAVVYDRSSVSNIDCTLVLTDIFGSALFSQVKSSSGNSAGNQLLTWNPGVGTHTIHIGCNLPAQTASGFSHFTTYRVITP